jgi:hypothetical protein
MLIKNSAIEVIMFISLLFYLLLFVAARSYSVTPKANSTVIADGKTCQQLLEAFQTMKDMTVEEDYHLTTTEKLINSKPDPLIQNQNFGGREQFVEYQRESK